MRAANLAVLVIVVAVALSPAVAADDHVMRVGTYDNRAIAIAYAHSDYLPHKEKMAELDAAKAAGDTARVRELENWGETHQHAVHLMGFGNAPVTELLALVGDGIPGVAENAGVDVIARACDFVGQDIEVVDVTMELVALFDPRQSAYDTIEAMEGVDPVPLAEIVPQDH